MEQVPIRVVAGIDFSECSNNAVHQTVELFKEKKIYLTLLHCYSDIIDSDDLSPDENIKTRNEIEKIYDFRLNEVKETILSAYRPNDYKIMAVETDLKKGYPEEVLVEYSRKQKADLIVMGSPVTKNSITGLLASVTSDLIRKCKIPVMAVPLLTNQEIPDNYNVLFLTNFLKSDYFVLHQLIQLTCRQGSTIYCIHFSHSKPRSKDYSRVQELQSYCNETYRNQKVKCEIVHGSQIDQTLDDFVAEKDINLMAVSRVRRNLVQKIIHTDISRHLLFHSHIPLIVFNS